MSSDELIAQFADVAQLLPEGRQFEIIAVGGAPLVLLGLRGNDGSTTDVDSAYDLDPALVLAASTVAERTGLPATWINANAQAFRPNQLTPGDVGPQETVGISSHSGHAALTCRRRKPWPTTWTACRWPRTTIRT